jgi:hypothetical protein
VTAAETQNNAINTTCEIADKKWIKNWFISTEAFRWTPGGRVQEITTGERFEPWILEVFNPVAQESKPGFTCNNLNHSINTIDELATNDTTGEPMGRISRANQLKRREKIGGPTWRQQSWMPDSDNHRAREKLNGPKMKGAAGI